MTALQRGDFEGVKIVGMTPEQRTRECMSIIKTTLDRYGCVIVPIVHIEGGDIQAGFRIAALERKGGEAPSIVPTADKP